ncbi:MAG: MFS transporter, partial [Clostridiales bacterium]|nr:MFS transporter [Clostridiales bacterium]
MAGNQQTKDKLQKDKLPKGIAPIALIMVLGALPPMLDTTIVNVAVNSLARIFDTSLPVVQWAVTGYVLALGIAVPFSGWLLRRMDGKKIFMGSLAAFLLGSLLAGFSWDIGSLIVFRLLQGLSAGILIPTLTTLIIQLAGSGNFGKLMSIVGIPAVFGPIIGPVAGGLIMQYLPWNWLFFVNLPIGAAGLALLQWKLPKFEASDKSAKLDWPGVMLLAATSGALIYGVTRVAHADTHAAGIAFLSAGTTALIAYVFYAFLRKDKALVSLALFR